MNIFNNCECISINLNNDYEPNRIAFDGCNYYFTLIECEKIIKLDLSFNIINTYNTSRLYDCISYDYKENCFWASSKKYSNKVFKLDCCFKEVGCITICDCQYINSCITGISYECDCNILLVSFNNAILQVCKNSGDIKLKYKSCDLSIRNILSISPGYIFTSRDCNEQSIYIYDFQNKVTERFMLDDDVIVKDIIFSINKKDNGCIILQFFMIEKGCKASIIKKPITLRELGYYPCCCNYNIYRKCCNDNYVDIVESIALEQAALSHILNAEGEKLQKVLEITNDINQILSINKEINKTIVNITHLEHTLYDKLSAVLELSSYNNCCNNSHKNATCMCNKTNINK